MDYTINRSPEQKPSLWHKEFVIDNLPPWIYSDNEQPRSLTEAKAKISALEYTIADIDLQIEIRELELRTGKSRHQSSFDYEKWRGQALRAKQTHMYLINAYKYWLIKNTPDELSVSERLSKLVQLLIDDPADFVEQCRPLLRYK
jgi:hypothetical protein